MYFRKKLVLLRPNYIVLRKKSVILVLFFLLLSPIILAEVVTLRTGKVVTGEIVLQNEEVLIIRTKTGALYQYPASEVLSVKSEELVSTELEEKASASRSVAVRLQTAGGAVYMPEIGWGGQFAVDLMLGTYAIQESKIFLGAGLGYRAKSFANYHSESKNATYSFLPLQAVVAMPVGKQAHSPFWGMSIGYGFALNKQTQGGICAGAEVGWNYEFASEKALQMSLFAELQQAKTAVRQVVSDVEYINHVGCNFIAMGVKLALIL